MSGVGGEQGGQGTRVRDLVSESKDVERSVSGSRLGRSGGLRSGGRGIRGAESNGGVQAGAWIRRCPESHARGLAGGPGQDKTWKEGKGLGGRGRAPRAAAPLPAAPQSAQSALPVPAACSSSSSRFLLRSRSPMASRPEGSAGLSPAAPRPAGAQGACARCADGEGPSPAPPARTRPASPAPTGPSAPPPARPAQPRLGGLGPQLSRAPRADSRARGLESSTQTRDQILVRRSLAA